MIEIECAGWYNDSCDDGPGVRSVLFYRAATGTARDVTIQVSRSMAREKWFPLEELMVFIELHCCNKKITISGGEPLEQVNSLEIVIRRLKGKGYNVCVYTGWEIVEYACKMDCNYIGINFPMDYCTDCGYMGRIVGKCPCCQSDAIRRLRRVSGYLAEEDRFTTGKRKELKGRRFHMATDLLERTDMTMMQRFHTPDLYDR